MQSQGLLMHPQITPYRSFNFTRDLLVPLFSQLRRSNEIHGGSHCMKILFNTLLVNLNRNEISKKTYYGIYLKRRVAIFRTLKFHFIKNCNFNKFIVQEKQPVHVCNQF